MKGRQEVREDVGECRVENDDVDMMGKRGK
jgi:hypothetical protein